VQDEQVDLVDTELAGALVEGVQRGVVAVVADPDLGLDEHVGPAHARAADALADLALVGVGRRGVDEAVPGAKVSTDSIVSSGGVWKTPKRRAGITTRLFKIRLIMQSG
jgi:hypothetical protein